VHMIVQMEGEFSMNIVPKISLKTSEGVLSNKNPRPLPSPTAKTESESFGPKTSPNRFELY